MFSRSAAVLGLRALERRDHLDDRATVLTLFARFTDELCSGLLVVLMPTLRRRLGLSVQQVGWCFQAMYSVGALVEPVTGVLIDLVRRRPLLVAGATAWGAALLLAAGAGGFGWLLAACALVGVAYGPLANTADVVLVEAHPDAVERIASRSTALDTLGALLAPGAVALAAWAGVDERLLLAGAGVGALGYAWLLAGTALPAPAPRPEQVTRRAELLLGIREVIADRRARPWIVALVLVEMLDPLEAFEPVWLADVVGASQSRVAVHVAVGTAASLAALVGLDRWLEFHDGRPVLVIACLGSMVLFPAWLWVPGFGAKLALVVVREAATAPLWPIVHARALAAVPGRGGAVTAVTAALGLLPLHAGFGWLAGRIGLTSSMLWLQLAVTATVLSLVRRAPSDAPVATTER
ncbi:MFS transporter [Nitriliruptor alkaliphilus]|uniref:MFS transporter n=1 Tax=Nitriliruptor alkaliphilus TaxID=427918 RepID=UPI000697013E|nr:MFS transporter [Nitriliruptor alkaliphilus]